MGSGVGGGLYLSLVTGVVDGVSLIDVAADGEGAGMLITDRTDLSSTRFFCMRCVVVDKIFFVSISSLPIPSSPFSPPFYPPSPLLAFTVTRPIRFSFVFFPASQQSLH